MPALFRDVTKDESETSLSAIFTTVRESITLVAPYVGMPSCLPAISGLVGELRHRGISGIPGPER